MPLIAMVSPSMTKAGPEMSALAALLSRERRMRVGGFNLSVRYHSKGARRSVERRIRTSGKFLREDYLYRLHQN